jgi:hypothetical protein
LTTVFFAFDFLEHYYFVQYLHTSAFPERKKKDSEGTHTVLRPKKMLRTAYINVVDTVFPLLKKEDKSIFKEN